jgi:hypothetical protein
MADRKKAGCEPARGQRRIATSLLARHLEFGTFSIAVAWSGVATLPCQTALLAIL